MAVIMALLLSMGFGAGDQYLGSFSAHPWAADVSQLSAPWLVLPFVAGASRRSVWSAAWCGAASTILALVGYCLMTLSPLENAHFTFAGVEAFLVAGNYRWFAAGLVTGPVFSWLGHRWHASRALPLAVGLASLVCFEPVARALAGMDIRDMRVVAGEIVAGVVMLVAGVLYRPRTRDLAPTQAAS